MIDRSIIIDKVGVFKSARQLVGCIMSDSLICIASDIASHSGKFDDKSSIIKSNIEHRVVSNLDFTDGTRNTLKRDVHRAEIKTLTGSRRSGHLLSIYKQQLEALSFTFHASHSLPLKIKIISRSEPLRRDSSLPLEVSYVHLEERTGWHAGLIARAEAMKGDPEDEKNEGASAGESVRMETAGGGGGGGFGSGRSQNPRVPGQ